MADIAAHTASIAGATADFVATDPLGDDILYTSGDLVIEFENGHVSPITISIAPTVTSGVISGAGRATIPTRSLVLAAGEHGVFLFKSSDISAYLAAGKKVPLDYTGGDADLLVRAVAVK